MTAAQDQPTARQQQREDTRKRILNAAIENFSQAGFEAASLSDIAKQAGVKNAQCLYRGGRIYPAETLLAVVYVS